MDKAFQGEHLIPGHIGQALVILSFGAALLSAISYYFATTAKSEPGNSWLWMGRIGFYINSICILGVGVCLFYILYNHYFEYHYAWSYTSKDLPVYYLEWLRNKGFPPGKMGMMLSSVYEIKINGLNTILTAVKNTLKNSRPKV